MATRNRKTRTTSTTNVPVDMTPIDIIDLTSDTVGDIVLRRRRRGVDSSPYLLPNNFSQPARTRHHLSRRRTIPIPDCAREDVDNSEDQHVTDDHQNSVIPIEDVIDLDDTEPNMAACINDSCSGQSRVLTCPICFKELSNKQQPTSTRCGHIFCGGCLERALKAAKKCPLCKRNVQLRSCTRLYF